MTQEDLAGLLGESAARQVARQLETATASYGRDRYRDALAALRRIAPVAAELPEVRELRGLTLYRLGRYGQALRELEVFFELTGSHDQHPVIADCERALGHHDRVDEIWAELRRAGVSSDVLAEGRLVEAGSLADRGELSEAISLLAPTASRALRHPEERHLRQWYMVADLYDRAGDVQRARELFGRLLIADPSLYDTAERLTALR